MNDDLISRQAVIDAIDKYNFDFPQYMERFVTELRDAMKADLKADIKDLPSATPIPCDDAISRQAALVAVKDALLAWSSMPEWRDNKVLEAIIDLPSAQPEIIRCKNCIHNNDCDIQYSAQAGENFFCGFGESYD